MSEWKPSREAPYDTPLRVRLENGQEITARLLCNVSMTSEGEDCDQWVAENEGEHPDCWTEGACWASNHNEVRSVQPVAFLPTPPQDDRHND